MHAVAFLRLHRRASGFTLMEALIAIAIMGILLAFGVPNMQDWLSSTKAAGAAQFYAEGMALARTQAMSNNSRSRIILTRNASNGQYDWQVDVCFPNSDDACAPSSGRWSTVDKAAATPEAVKVKTLSIRRSADGLPQATILTAKPAPEGGTSVYFTQTGWLDGNNPGLTRIDLAPPTGRASAFPASRVELTLAGMATVCRPDALPGDSRRCPR